jgi:hypothetical protein
MPMGPVGPPLRVSSRSGWRVLIGSHDFDKIVFGDGVACFAAQDVFEARQGAALIVQTHEIRLRIFDAPARECADMDECLVPRGNGNWSAIRLSRLFTLCTKWYFEMKTGLSNRVPMALFDVRR